MLKRCEETNLVLNWEKCHFMVKEGIILGHKVSGSGIEFDKAKIEAMSKLPYPTNVKAIQSFLGHVGFYRRFIKDFSQVALPMTQLLEKDALFNFFEDCIHAFDKLKHELTQAPIIIKPDWSLPFEVMCNASNYAVGAVLGQRIEKHFKPTHYASKTINEAQENYTMTEKELLAVVFAFEKFCQYLVLSKTIILLLQEFDIEIRDKKGAKNLAVNQLSWLENPDLGKLTKAKIRDLFPEERLMEISDKNNEPCVTVAHQEGIMVLLQPQEKSSKLAFTSQVSSAMHIDWSEVAMPINEPATSPLGMKYLEKAQDFLANDARNVVNFLKRLFMRFRIPKALISDRGAHFYNYQMEKVMKRHGVVPDSPPHITPRQTGRSKTQTGQ
ncbi:reverse transcriptase domain-containing protein [Tanacetum coccineum]